LGSREQGVSLSATQIHLCLKILLENKMQKKGGLEIKHNNFSMLMINILNATISMIGGNCLSSCKSDE